MYLEKYLSGKWMKVASWNIGGIGNVHLSEEYIGILGTTYITKVVIYMNGEKVTSTSMSI